MRDVSGCRVLIVEDEYLVAMDLAEALEERGILVVGPVASVGEALEQIENGQRLDAAVLDVNLGGERVYRVAEALSARGVPFIFTTGYDADLLPESLLSVPRLEKPADPAGILRVLFP